ncbi:MAG: hypothetical protein FWC64_05390 [Treponema sp.]|nr:hypothetical protein [Treponema sp.]
MSLAKIVYDEGNIHLMAGDIYDDLVKAAIATVNIQARMARREAVKNIQENFTIRNNFTVRQVQFTPMPEGRYKLTDVKSVVGVTEKADYMVRQEEGGERTSRGQTLAIPTDTARGGNRSNTVIAAMRINRIKRNKRMHGSRSNKKAKGKSLFIARAFVAYSKGLFLPMGGSSNSGPGDRRNLHKVVSFEKRNRKLIRFRTIQVYIRDRESTETEAQPWLFPASEVAAAEGQGIFNSQAKKLGL